MDIFINNQSFMRRYRPEDQESIIQLIDSIYQEYEDKIYLQNADSDLLDIEKNYLLNGDFWVVTVADNPSLVIGCIAVKIDVNNLETAFLKRFYLMPEYRGSGLAQKMHEAVINWCQQHNVKKISLWSDTRFSRAHVFYQKNGYVQQAIRDMDDGAMPYQEFYFVKFL